MVKKVEKVENQLCGFSNFIIVEIGKPNYLDQKIMFRYKILYLPKSECHHNNGTNIKKRRTLHLF